MGRKRKKLEPGDYLKKKDAAYARSIKAEFSRRARPGKKRVIIGSLTLTMVGQDPYGSHCVNMYQLGRDHPDYDFQLVTPRRVPIDAMRNMVVELGIRGDFDYLYFFDDDTLNDRDVLGRLLTRMDEFNAISAGYFIRGYPFEPMVFEWKDRENVIMQLMSYRNYKSKISSDGVLRDNVAGVGCGCTLFRMEDFKKIPYPWFATGHNHTEDAYFFTMAHHNIKDYKVGMDFNVVCGHMLDPLHVDANNADILRSTYRKLLKMGSIRP